MNFKKGFTLIELLVVTAIIALLAAIIMMLTSNSRIKTGDASIQSNLNTVKNQAELFYYNNSNSYVVSGTTPATFGPAGCPAYSSGSGYVLIKDKAIADAITEAKSRSAAGIFTSCAISSTTWAVAVELKSSVSNNAAWCVDSSGKSKRYGGPTGSAINPATFLCN